MKQIVMLLLLPFFFASCEEKAVKPLASATASANSKVVVAARAKLYRSGCSYCTCGRGNCSVAYTSEQPTAQKPKVLVSISDGKMDLLFDSYVDPADGEVLTLESSDQYYIDANVAADLGYSAVKVLQGSYTIDFTRGNYGGVRLNVETTL